MVTNFIYFLLVLLNVSAPFHSTLMKPIAATFTSTIQQALPQESTVLHVPVISNVTARPMLTTGEALQLLPLHLHSPVRWYDSVAYCVEEMKRKSDTVLLLEMGPKQVLAPLSKSFGVQTHFCGTFADVDAFVNSIYN